MDKLKFAEIAECVEAVRCEECKGTGSNSDDAIHLTEVAGFCKFCKGTGIRPDSNLGELLLLKKLQA